MKVKHWDNLKRSFELAFKNKWLILISVFLVSVTSLQYNNNSSNNNNYRTNNISLPSQQGLMKSTNAFDSFFETIKQDSVFGIFLLVFFVVSLVVLSIIIKTYATNFAVANFYYAIKDEDEGNKIELTHLSNISRKKVWDLFVAYLYSGIIYFTLILFIVVVISLSFLDTTGLLAGISIVFGSLIGLLVFLSFIFSSIYWEYLVLFRNKKGTEAVNLSFKYSVKYILDNFVFRGIQCLVGCGLYLIFLIGSAVILAILGLLFLMAGGLLQLSGFTLIISLPFLTILSLGLISLLTIGSAVITLILGIYGYLFNKDILKDIE